MLKVLHITPGLESGGAEMMLLKLVANMDRARYQNVVVSLTDDGQFIGKRIRESGVPLTCLDFRRGIPDPRLVSILSRFIRQEAPDIVQTWMYHANAIGSVANAISIKRPLIWSLHAVELNQTSAKLQTRLVIRSGAPLARLYPDTIVCCSEAAMQCHESFGYPKHKMTIIENGIDANEFMPNPQIRSVVRKQLDIRGDAPMIGYIARFTGQKDHHTFFRAAGILSKRRPDVQFVLCGTGITPDNPALMGMVRDADVDKQTHLLGTIDGLADFTASLDISTCTSATGESFCLALAEAMACGVPCVTTDLAGPATLVGGIGRVVPVRNADAIASAWEELLNLDADTRSRLGELSRKRILEKYTLDVMVRHYENLYDSYSKYRTDKPLVV